MLRHSCRVLVLSIIFATEARSIYTKWNTYRLLDDSEIIGLAKNASESCFSLLSVAGVPDMGKNITLTTFFPQKNDEKSFQSLLL